MRGRMVSQYSCGLPMRTGSESGMTRSAVAAASSSPTTRRAYGSMYRPSENLLMLQNSMAELKARRVKRGSARKANSRVLTGPESLKNATPRGMTGAAPEKRFSS